MRLHVRAAQERRVEWRRQVRRTRHQGWRSHTEPCGSVYTWAGGAQEAAARAPGRDRASPDGRVGCEDPVATLQSDEDDDSLRETVPLSGWPRYLVAVAQRASG